MQDRNGQQVPGTLVVAGDFNRAITLNVSRMRLADPDLTALSPAETQGAGFRQQLRDGIIKQLASQPGVFDFDVLAAAEREEESAVYVDLEYEVSTCRGDIIEGLRGRRRCARFGRAPHAGRLRMAVRTRVLVLGRLPCA